MIFLVALAARKLPTRRLMRAATRNSLGGFFDKSLPELACPVRGHMTNGFLGANGIGGEVTKNIPSYCPKML